MDGRIPPNNATTIDSQASDVARFLYELSGTRYSDGVLENQDVTPPTFSSPHALEPAFTTTATALPQIPMSLHRAPGPAATFLEEDDFHGYLDYYGKSIVSPQTQAQRQPQPQQQPQHQYHQRQHFPQQPGGSTGVSWPSYGASNTHPSQPYVIAPIASPSGLGNYLQCTPASLGALQSSSATVIVPPELPATVLTPRWPVPSDYGSPASDKPSPLLSAAGNSEAEELSRRALEEKEQQQPAPLSSPAAQNLNCAFADAPDAETDDDDDSESEYTESPPRRSSRKRVAKRKSTIEKPSTKTIEKPPVKKKKKSRATVRQPEVDKLGRVCSHCGATSSPSWRRGENYCLLCNACGL